jgi:hypothetical protein
VGEAASRLPKPVDEVEPGVVAAPRVAPFGAELSALLEKHQTARFD